MVTRAVSWRWSLTIQSIRHIVGDRSARVLALLADAPATYASGDTSRERVCCTQPTDTAVDSSATAPALACLRTTRRLMLSWLALRTTNFTSTYFAAAQRLRSRIVTSRPRIVATDDGHAAQMCKEGIPDTLIGKTLQRIALMLRRKAVD